MFKNKKEEARRLENLKLFAKLNMLDARLSKENIDAVLQERKPSDSIVIDANLIRDIASELEMFNFQCLNGVEKVSSEKEQEFVQNNSRFRKSLDSIDDPRMQRNDIYTSLKSCKAEPIGADIDKTSIVLPIVRKIKKQMGKDKISNIEVLLKYFGEECKSEAIIFEKYLSTSINQSAVSEKNNSGGYDTMYIVKHSDKKNYYDELIPYVVKMAEKNFQEYSKQHCVEKLSTTNLPLKGTQKRKETQKITT